MLGQRPTWALPMTYLVAVCAAAGAPSAPFAAGGKQAAARVEQVRDCYGDPLPPGAIARMGTVRLRHPGVLCVAYSADGSTIASAGFNSTVHIWDARTGKEIRRFGKARSYGTPRFAVFSADGKLVATGDQHARGGLTIRVREMATGKQLLEIENKSLQIDYLDRTIAFSPDGRILFVGGQDGKVYRCEVATGNQLGPLVMGPGQMESIAISPDGKLLAASISGAPIRLWDLTADRLRLQLSNSISSRHSLAFSPDSKTLVAASAGHSPCLFDVMSGKVVRRLGPNGTCAAFSPDGKMLAIACGSQVRRWLLHTAKELPRLPVPGEGARSLSFSPDSAFLAAASNFNTIRVWDMASGKEILAERGNETPVRCLAFAPDGQTLATGSMDPHVRLWDRAGKERNSLYLKNTWVEAVAFAPDGKILATGSLDKYIRLWEAASGKLLREWPTNGTNMRTLAFAPDGKVLGACNAQDGRCLWDSTTGKAIERFQAVKGGDTMAFSPNGKLLAINANGQAHLWEMASGEELLRFTGKLSGTGRLVWFSHDSATLCAATLGQGVTVSFWDVDSGRDMHHVQLPADEIAFCYALTPDGRTLAVGGYVPSANKPGTPPARPVLTLWEVRTGQVRRRLATDQGQPRVLAFAADGVLASAGEDTTVLLWDGVRPTTGASAGDGLSLEKVKDCWAALGGADAARAYDAVCELVRSPRAALKLLLTSLKPVRTADPKRTAALLRALGSPKFAEREKTTVELEDLAEAAEPALRLALKTAQPEESRRRIERLLEKLDPLLSVKRLRELRAVEVLEGIGSPEARRLLEVLAKGLPEAQLTREARGALGRIAARR
jgi:WD40 repeat protein